MTTPQSKHQETDALVASYCSNALEVSSGAQKLHAKCCLLEQQRNEAMASFKEMDTNYQKSAAQVLELQAENQSLIAQMAVMVGTLKKWPYDKGICQCHSHWQAHAESCPVQQAINSTPFAAKDLLERVKKMENGLKEIRVKTTIEFFCNTEVAGEIDGIAMRALSTTKQPIE